MQPTFLSFAVLGAIFIEIAGFIIVGSRIGVLATLALIMISMLAGVYLLRVQGISILRRMQNELSAGRTPDRELAEGAMVVIGAILLIIPGFVSDIAGILLFLRPVRGFIWRQLSKRPPGRRPPGKKPAPPAKTIDLDESDYQARDPHNSPWRKP